LAGRGRGLSCPQQTPAATDALAEAVVRRADEVRFPADGFELTVSIRTTSGGKETDWRTYRVLSRATRTLWSWSHIQHPSAARSC
jgi:hypothetical protein